MEVNHSDSGLNQSASCHVIHECGLHLILPNRTLRSVILVLFIEFIFLCAFVIYISFFYLAHISFIIISINCFN